MLQTIIPIGNSYGVIIPKELLDKLGFKQGDKVKIRQNEGYQQIIMDREGSKNTSPTVTPEFKSWLDEFTTKHHDMLKELAKTP